MNICLAHSRQPRSLSALLACGVLLASAVAAAAPTTAAAASGSSPPVVLFVLDEFSLGTMMTASKTIDAQRFPQLASLGKTATWYRHHTTVADSTGSAVPAIYTGQRPGVPDWGAIDKNHNLFEMLKDRYRIQAYEPEPFAVVCDPATCPATPSASRLLGKA
ncbi:MAG: hypothetical protein F2813_05450, partial [Actinobacteria bacterium]|nr:hypothetical protein [Actinomycetota bacterium]